MLENPLLTHASSVAYHFGRVKPYLESCYADIGGRSVVVSASQSYSFSKSRTSVDSTYRSYSYVVLISGLVEASSSPSLAKEIMCSMQVNPFSGLRPDRHKDNHTHLGANWFVYSR